MIYENTQSNLNDSKIEMIRELYRSIRTISSLARNPNLEVADPDDDTKNQFFPTVERMTAAEKVADNMEATLDFISSDATTRIMIAAKLMMNLIERSMPKNEGNSNENHLLVAWIASSVVQAEDDEWDDTSNEVEDEVENDELEDSVGDEDEEDGSGLFDSSIAEEDEVSSTFNDMEEVEKKSKSKKLEDDEDFDEIANLPDDPNGPFAHPLPEEEDITAPTKDHIKKLMAESIPDDDMLAKIKRSYQP